MLAAPLFGEGGRVRGGIVALIDITERRRGEAHKQVLLHELAAPREEHPGDDRGASQPACCVTRNRPRPSRRPSLAACRPWLRLTSC